MNRSDTIRVVLVESRRLLREALRSLLEGTGFTVIAEASGAADIVGTLQTHSPDVVLLALAGSDESDFALLQRLPEITERVSVLVMTSDPDPTLHTQAIELGAMGIVTNDQSCDVLEKALRKVVAGELWLDRTRTASLVNRLTRRSVHTDPEAAKIESLTPRERQIVTLVTEGLTNKDIAERLFISEATARNHLTSILDKLDLRDRFQLTVYAFRRGLVVCPQTPAMLRFAAMMHPAPAAHDDVEVFRSTESLEPRGRSRSTQRRTR